MLQELPTVNCISLEESLDRRILLEKQFQQYDIKNINFLISKRYNESEDKIEGKFSHTLNEGTAGCCVSHLKNIERWYNTTSEKYGFFCEDDLSLKTVKFWKRTWKDFLNTLPEDWDCIQLLTIRNDSLSLDVRPRIWNDWGATAYILKRDYAKLIIDTYINKDVFKLELPDPNSNVQPLIENLLFTIGKTYTVPLFIENIEDFDSTFVSADTDVDASTQHKNNHVIAAQKVLELWEQNKEISTFKSNTDSDLYNFATDINSPEYNFKMGIFYFEKGHTAPALSFFLRCAERTDDDLLAYEALIYGYHCYKEQKIRDETAKSLIMHAVCLIPERPEARWLLSMFYEQKQHWMYSYYHANRGLETCDFKFKPLTSYKDYPGKIGLLFQKAVSGYWWGKQDECIEILKELKDKYVLPSHYKKLVYENLNRVGVKCTLDEPIPVIGVPIVNGVNWLERLIQSIDYPVEQLFIINNNGRNQITKELDEITKKEHPFIKKIQVVHMPSNLGVPASWNLVIKCFINAPYWVIVNHDIAFSPGFLEKLVDKANKLPNVGALLGAEKQWDVFLLKDFAVQACGLFDENLYPAYVEDWDYLFRLNGMNIKWDLINEPYMHGDRDYATTGSQTWRVEENLKEKLSKCRDANELEYIAAKWGPEWLKDWYKDYSLSPWQYPFNNCNIPYSYTTYDLEFVRKKYLGF